MQSEKPKLSLLFKKKALFTRRNAISGPFSGIPSAIFDDQVPCGVPATRRLPRRSEPESSRSGTMLLSTHSRKFTRYRSETTLPFPPNRFVETKYT